MGPWEEGRSGSEGSTSEIVLLWPSGDLYSFLCKMGRLDEVIWSLTPLQLSAPIGP